jgi:hypothetical protein
MKPPIAHNWLERGHSRWYVRARPPFTVDLEIVQPTTLPELRDQRVDVRLDGATIAAAAIEPQRPYRLSFASPGDAPRLYAIDITASATASVGRDVLSVQVPRLLIRQGDGREMRLSQ